ncbi:trypsin-like peptidase domain-containing protein [Streptomyces polygonati]|uniref:Trypsin-like peptidase domain-containing protein n=1 Tax=Streptomyces polygonati TaxID=1617087 RepID=A0ABV8HLB5_9ACTN
MTGRGDGAEAATAPGFSAMRRSGALGRVLDDRGVPFGTCFQVAPGIVVTAWHVLAALGRAETGAVVSVGTFHGPAAPAEVVAVGPLWDLAVLRRAEPLPGTVPGLVPTQTVDLLTEVVVTGVPTVDDPGHDYLFLDAPGVWQGGTVRDTHISLGRLTSSSVVPGMSGAPVLRRSDNAVLGVVTSRYNSADGWLRDSVWVARTEDLVGLLTGVPGIDVRAKFLVGQELSVVLAVTESPSYGASGTRPAGDGGAGGGAGAGQGRQAAGLREAALEAARVLVGLDGSCLGSVGPIDMAQVLLHRLGSREAFGHEVLRGLGARLRQRGLDPRVLLPAAPGHDEARRRWLAPLAMGPEADPAPAPVSVSVSLPPAEEAAPDALLAALVEVIAGELPGTLFSDVSETCRRYLALGFAGRPSVSLPGFLSALADHLPPLRAGTEIVSWSAAVEAPAEDAGTSTAADQETSGEGAAGHHPAPSAPERGGRTPASGTRHSLGEAAAQLARLPDPDPLVAGREAAVDHAVRAIGTAMAKRNRSTAFFSGQPGAGTSTVAVEVARQLAPLFPGGVFHIDLFGLLPGSRRDARTVTRLISEALGLTEGRPALDDAGLFARLTADLADRQVLLLLDNALDASHVAPLAKAAPGCCVIVTSRDRVQGYADPGLVFTVAPLDRADSIEVLARCGEGRDDERTLLDRLADLCDDVPLALRMVGARLTSSPDLDLRYLIQLLAEETTRLDYMETGDRAVRVALRLSYDALDDPAKRVFRLLTAAPGSAGSAPELGHCVDEPPYTQELLLNRLADRSLARNEVVRVADGSMLATFFLFDLPRLFARERLADEEPADTVREFRGRSTAFLSRRLREMTGYAADAQISAELDPARFEAALHMAEEHDWLDTATQLAIDLHVLALGRGEVDAIEAINGIRASLHLRGGDPEQAAKAFLDSAESLMSKKAFGAARTAARESIRIAEAHDLGLPLANARFRLSLILWELEAFTQALQAGADAARKLMDLGQEAAAVPVAINNSKTALAAGDVTQGRFWAAKASELAERWGDGEERAIACEVRSRAAARAGDLGEAVALSRRSAAWWEEAQVWENAAINIENAARYALWAEDVTTGAELLNIAVAHLERGKLSAKAATDLGDLGALQFRVGSYAQACFALDRALRTLTADDPATPALLPVEIRLRRAAVVLFAPELADSDAPLPAPAGPPEQPAAETSDTELSRVGEILRRHQAGELALADTLRQVEDFLATDIRNRPAPSEPWLYTTMGKVTSPRQALD